MGLFGSSNGLAGFFGGIAERAPIAAAMVDGDYASAARLQGQLADRRTANEKAKQDRLMRQEMIGSLRSQGVPDDQITILMANPEKLSEQFSTRFATRNVDEGNSIYTPSLDGGAGVFTAPKTFQEGADVIQTGPRQSRIPPPLLAQPGEASAAPRPVWEKPIGTRIGGLRSEAEQYADAIAQRGTRQWGAAVRDFVLKGDGPSAHSFKGQQQGERQGHATGMQDDRQQHSDGQLGRRLDVTRRGQNIGRDNSIRSTGQSDTNNVRSNETRLQTAGGRRGGAGTPVRVNTLQQARRLRPGTLFQTPDGRIKVR